jgi:glycosyltransferase involved in cell wall biosynthesis/predicted SAM-dependent methyltransferase
MGALVAVQEAAGGLRLGGCYLKAATVDSSGATDFMKIDFYSPLPPAKTGIADYSAALLKPLSRLADVEVVARADDCAAASRGAMPVYQLGNNPHHDFVYQAALERPGIAVLHEANLHYLIAQCTLARGKPDTYWQEVERNGGAATSWAKIKGPDYSNPMLHSILGSAKAVITHSRAVEDVVRNYGYCRPVARIPHGVWNYGEDWVAAQRARYRAKLGVAEQSPLFGIFGFLKPYKRIKQALRAFRRMVSEIRETRLILVGEKHPELSLELPPEATHLGYVAIEDFEGYLAACDIIVNLRYPTVGETSGTVSRAFGMGKAVLVSDVGAFAEYAENTCIRVPVDESEEEFLVEYMRLLASRPEVARALGQRARAWAQQECSWESVARKYLQFTESVFDDPIARWNPFPSPYLEAHRARIEKTLSIIPRGDSTRRILEMGAYMQMTPALATRLGYGEVRGCYSGPLGKTESRTTVSQEGEAFTCEIDLFDAESDRFPYDDGAFHTVLCCELIEHLQRDPMRMMAEIHRILADGGCLVMTTPNVTSLRAIAAVLRGFHPMLFPPYLRPSESREARHAREYTPREVRDLLENSGFKVMLLETGPFREEPQPGLGWVGHLLRQHSLPEDLRGECIFAVGRKIGPLGERYPEWLYS